MRLECLKRYEGMGELLAAKDQMVWKLLREREGAAADVEALSKASTTEMEEWKQCVQPSGVSTCTLSFVVFTHRLQFDRPTHGTAAEVQDGVRVLRCEVCVCVCVCLRLCLFVVVSRVFCSRNVWRVRLSDGSVNSDCAVNTPANAARRTAIPVDSAGPEAARGSRRHYFVKVGDK